MPTKNHTLSLMTISLLAISGCSSDSEVLDTLYENREKWESLNVADYQFNYRNSCFCSTDFVAPRLVVVNDDQITSVSSIESRVALDTAIFETQSISQLFERIALEESRAEQLIVEYQ